MKLKDLPTDRVSAVVTAPFKVEQPAELWVRARNQGLVPERLYLLYRIAGCLDPTTPPKYLSEYQSIALFSFFKAVMDGLCDALVEANEYAEELKRLRQQEWTEVGAWMKERDEHPAIEAVSGFPRLHSEEVTRLEPRVFRSFLLVLGGALDQSAELVSFFSGDAVKGLRTGQAAFERIVEFLETPAPTSPLVSTPTSDFLRALHAALSPILIVPDGPEKDWYNFFKLYRNKLAHLGRYSHFRFGIGDENRRIFFFLQKDWPFSLESAQRIREEPSGMGLPLFRGRPSPGVSRRGFRMTGGFAPSARPPTARTETPPGNRRSLGGMG